MGEELIPVDAAEHSIDILQFVQNSDWYAQDKNDPAQVRTYYRNADGTLNPREEIISVTDFLSAVDYYLENRDADVLINAAMQKPDGVVRVWKGPESNKQVAVTLTNITVPTMLEFAYQLVRSAQKDSPQA